MQIETPCQVHPGILKIQRLLQKIDRLHLPQSSRCDAESILIRQVSKELDHALPWQAGHGQRTAAIAIKIGQAAALDTNELHHLRLAALLHDIGLLMLPAHLVGSKDPLDSDAYADIQNHSRLGATLLAPFSFLQEASTLVAHHHERWDGSGYPFGIRGSFIPLGGRILAIADAYDAIKFPSAADPAIRNRIVLRILRVASGTQFDPQLVEALGPIQESLSASDLTESVKGDCLDPR